MAQDTDLKNDFILDIIGHHRLIGAAIRVPAPMLEVVMLGNSGGKASRGVTGIGIGLIHSCSSRCLSSIDTVQEKLTACAFRCGVVVV